MRGRLLNLLDRVLASWGLMRTDRAVKMLRQKPVALALELRSWPTPYPDVPGRIFSLRAQIDDVELYAFRGDPNDVLAERLAQLHFDLGRAIALHVVQIIRGRGGRVPWTGE